MWFEEVVVTLIIHLPTVLTDETRKCSSTYMNLERKQGCAHIVGVDRISLRDVQQKGRGNSGSLDPRH